jgi:hypothetical protein
VERKLRALEEGERIDVAALAIDVSALPSFNSAEVPSPEAVADVVDAFFGQVAAADLQSGLDAFLQAQCELQPASPPEAPAIGAVVPAPGQDASQAQLRRGTGARRGRIDLSALD